MNSVPTLVLEGIQGLLRSLDAWISEILEQRADDTVLPPLSEDEEANVGLVLAEPTENLGIQKLNPNVAADRERLYRYFLSSLSTDPIPRDDQFAEQANYVSEHILWKSHPVGPWELWLRKYLEDGNPLNIRDYNGKAPLHHAVVTDHNRDDKVRALVEAGADIAMKDFMDQTPVDLARDKNEQIFIFLLKTWQKSVVAEQQHQDRK